MLTSLNLITTHVVKTNQEHNGTEVYFSDFPTVAERNALKSAGFRWSSFNKCWYIKTAKLTSGNVKNTNSQQQNSREITTHNVKNIYGVEVGDLYCSSFGYDMTLLNFYQVTKIIGKCMVEVREIRGKCVDGSAGYSGHMVPARNSFTGEPVRKKITLYYGNTEPKKENTCFKDEHHHAYFTTETAKHYFNYMD